ARYRALQKKQAEDAAKAGAAKVEGQTDAPATGDDSGDAGGDAGAAQ
ncbi:4-amino-4-deoxychorismate lyase, partial [Mesorhizobium sp. M4B.F.Ca.ET.088.02.2.1]